MIHAIEILQRVFEHAVAAIGAIQNPRARGAGAKIVNCLMGRRNRVLIIGHAHIVVGAGQNGVAPFDDGFCLR